MPRNVRNFWFDAWIDGKQEKVSSGPRAKNGGMDIVLKVRNKGSVVGPVAIRCQAAGEKLIVSIRDDVGNEVYRQETIR